MDFIPVNEPLLNGNEKKYLCECIDTGWISSEGPFVKDFEQKMSATVNRKYGVAVSNGTVALEVVVEAMTLGCPVAVSNKYAMSEQVGDARLLFDPDSLEEIAGCIKKMWQDEELRQEMIRKGYVRMAKWTANEFGNRLVKIINKL